MAKLAHMDSQQDRCATCKLDEQRRKKAAYMRKWRKEHPDKDREQQIRKAKNLLKRNGYTCTKDGETNGAD